MLILTHQQISEFITMRSYIFRDNTLTLEEKGLYGVLYTAAQRGQKDISRYIDNNNMDKVLSLLKSLNKKGYIDYDKETDSIGIPEMSFKEVNEIL